MYIKKIKIENFRSITKAELELDKINVFYGLNDAGKSNVLKALNLFFNGYTEYDKKYDFSDDFCQYTLASIKKAKQAPEIRIEIILCYYVDGSEFSWKKVWRKEGLYSDDLDASHKKSSWARSLIYRYVPAMKDKNYFSKLLTEFYDAFSVSVGEQLRNASSTLVKVIERNTETLSEDVRNALKIETKVSLPSNLSNLFSFLDFQTENRNGEFISLDNRGDGIKIRHIPSILGFFAKQQNLNLKKGKTKVHTVWGYEEPENNLELKASFEKAEQLKNLSSDIQMLITTHSPAFYTLGENEYAKMYKAVADKQGTKYLYNLSEKAYESDEGYLALLSPFITEKVSEIEELKKEIKLLNKNGKLFSSHVLFVEGKTDKLIIEHFLKYKYPDVNIYVVDSGGCVQARKNMISWLYNPNIEKCPYISAVLFDGDKSGIGSKECLVNYIKSSNLKKISNKYKLLTISPSSFLKNIRRELGESYGLTIEHTFSPQTWKYAKDKNWLDELSKTEICKLALNFESYNDPTVTLEKFLEEKFNDDEKIYIFNKIKDNCKEKFAKYVTTQSISNFDELERILKPFLDKIKEINVEK